MGRFIRLLVFVALTLVILYRYVSHARSALDRLMDQGRQEGDLRQFQGFQLYEWKDESVKRELYSLPQLCVSALTARLDCDARVRFLESGTRGQNPVRPTRSVCAAQCRRSLMSWFDTVTSACDGYNVLGATANLAGGKLWAAYNETCLKEPMTGQYCRDVTAGFKPVDSTGQLSPNDTCSYCNIEHLRVMQSSRYSNYDQYWQSRLQDVQSRCGLNGPTELHAPFTTPPLPAEPFCLSGNHHTSVPGDTIDSIATTHNVSSVSLWDTNFRIWPHPKHLEPGTRLCLPRTCERMHVIQDNDTCDTVARKYGSTLHYDVIFWNPWIFYGCSNFRPMSNNIGKVLCASTPGGRMFRDERHINPSLVVAPGRADGLASTATAPPAGVPVADGTMRECGAWHVATSGETCPTICIRNSITNALFLQANPSLSKSRCSDDLKSGAAYCVGPVLVEHDSQKDEL
ncbi:hypothetical protein ANO11243_084540 [Dothideomycetidae sp. 11243]|nr:hypothetical protein ANO11243_084540 [fungal sp. No.11243]